MFSVLLMNSQTTGSSQVEQTCDCWLPGKADCQHVQSPNRDYAEIDFEDIANSVMQVMCVCRLRAWEVKRTKDVIKRSFRHYEEIRTRIDRVPEKRFNKENFIHDLAVEAGMQRMDGHLAYGIVKRAFRAYYHGTGEGGKRLEIYAQQMRHRYECLWDNAAKRTAEIFAIYAGLMYNEQQQYFEYFRCIYLHLYNEIASRWTYEVDVPRTCECKAPDQTRVESIWDALSGTTMMSATTNITTELFFNKQSFRDSNPNSAVSIKMEYTMVVEHPISFSDEPLTIPNESSNQAIKSERSSDNEPKLPTKKKSKKKKNKKKKRETKCKCPNLECNGEQRPPVITAECSQGSFICRWIPHEESFPAHFVPCPPMKEVCPPCDYDTRPCDIECTCTCEVCTCPPADEFVEEEHAEQLSGTGLEDRDTDFCWLATLRDSADNMLQYSDEMDVEDDVKVEEEEEEEKAFDCTCTCEYKKRAFPHLFTHLEPFKTPPSEVPAEEVPVEEPTQPRKPPCGISMETYRCWNQPLDVEALDSEPNCRTCPHITALAAALTPQEKPQTKVTGISMDVTVKSQHYPSNANSSGKAQNRGKEEKSHDTTKNKSPINEQKTRLKEPIPLSQRKSCNKDAVVTVKPGKRVSIKKPIAKLPDPKPNPQPPVAPNNTTQEQTEDTLTKDDVLKMLGL